MTLTINPTSLFSALCAAALSLFVVQAGAAPEGGKVNVAHAIAMHGTPKYPAGFTHLGYANPKAPKGGRIRLAAVNPGGFDSLNPWIPKGIAAAGISMIYDTLAEGTLDEPFTQYGLLAEKLEWPEDRSWIIFHLRPQARFHDGKAVTAEDVRYTFELLTTKGSPMWRFYYHDVRKVEALDTRRVKFTFANGDNRELALIVGQMPVLPKHHWEKNDFTAANLSVPPGSGPYRVKEVQAGRSIVYERVADYWGKDLALNRGRYNLDEIEYDYYRDDTVALEALKAGEYDLRVESSAKNWATAYNVPPVQQKMLRRGEFALKVPAGMQGFFFNIRREPFKDRKVRQALNYAFDFEWANKNLMFSAYTRTDSYFENSDLAASGVPVGGELDILEPFRKQLPPELFIKPVVLPKTDGSGNNRSGVREATRLLAEAGWKVVNGKLVDKTGKQMRFEILIDNPLFEPHTQSFVQNLKRLGIDASIRLLADAQQYENRLRTFDFDMIVGRASQSNSPGNEQRDYWTSTAAKTNDSRNYIGIQDPVVDALVEKLIVTRSREELVNTTRALDRVLMNGWYVVPHWHLNKARVAWWDRFGMPAVHPDTGPSPEYWWFDAAKSAALDARRGKKSDR
jgi:microcin C transport system substrate-binding protein